MAGHLSLRTARAHYARGRSGWAIDDLPRLAEDREREVGIARDEEPADVADAVSMHPELDILPEPGCAPKTERPSHLRPGTPPAAIARWFAAHKARIDDLHEWLARRREEVADTTPAPDQPDPTPESRF